MRTRRQVEPVIQRYRALKDLHNQCAGKPLAVLLSAWQRDRERSPGVLPENTERTLLDLIVLKGGISA